MAPSELWHLLADNQTAIGRSVTTAAIVVGGFLVAWVVGRLAGRASADVTARYYARKLGRYTVGLVTVIVLAVYWRPFGG